MKKIFIAILLTGFSMVLISSCNKLEEKPLGNLTPASFYKTQSDAVAAMTAVYSTLSTDINNDFAIYGRNLNLLVDNPSDNQVYSPSNTNPDVRALGTGTYVSTNDRVRKIYGQLYWSINKANIAIDKIAEIPATEFKDPNQDAFNLIRQARFIRALQYFNLVRLFGDVPLILHDLSSLKLDELKVDRAPKTAVYGQIIADLDSASLLPSNYTGNNVGRVTAGAAKALLAKVYVTKHDWQNAKIQLEKVITAGTGFSSATGNYGYDLFTKFSDAFQPATKNGKEHIFSAQFNGTTGGFVSNQSLSSFTWTPSAYTTDIPADASVITTLFQVADQRRGATFYDSLFNQSTQKWVKWPFFNFLKLVDQSAGFTAALPGSQGSSSKVNFPVLRYADVLLLYAEVLNELNGAPSEEAYKAVNIVRGRAFNSYEAGGIYTDHEFDLQPGACPGRFPGFGFYRKKKRIYTREPALV